MIQNYKIDQARTFATLMLLGVSPKLAFGDNERQETSKAGLPKWVAQLAAEFRAFGRPVRELINVTIDAERNPGDGLAPGTFMELIDFEIGVMEKRNREKAALLYTFLDQSQFFVSPVAKADRSLMNVPFTLKKAELDEEFLKGAKSRGMIQLKGHRSVGGMRASIYNAMPIEGVKALVDYMKEFEAKHG